MAFMTSFRKRLRANRWFYLLFLPAAIYFILFWYFPMYGVSLAFKDYRIVDGILGSPWADDPLKYFKQFFDGVFFARILNNTLLISFYKLIFGFPIPIILALMLNEVKLKALKRSVQTISYLPYFISWVVIGGMLTELLSPTRGTINRVIDLLGHDPIYFLGDVKYFRSVLVISDIWKTCGWSSVIYLAAISAINQEEYESAYIDGASVLQIMWYITIKAIRPTIVILFILQLGRILHAGFDQVFNLYNELVYEVGDIIDTYIYRVGLIKIQYSLTTAVGLFKNIIGFVLVFLSNYVLRFIGEGETRLW